MDQAALQAAQTCRIECGGWCPPGRICETGAIPPTFPLNETPNDRTADAQEIPRSERTQWNVRDSDATLILRPAGIESDPGTDWAIRCATKYERPFLVCDPLDAETAATIEQWLGQVNPQVLNIAGPAESRLPGIGEQVYTLLVHLLGTRFHPVAPGECR